MSVYSLRNINNLLQKNSKYFIDTNILLGMHGLTNNPVLQEEYQSIIDILLEEECPIFMDSITLSEFINRYMRELFRERFNKSFYKKEDIRGTAELTKVLQFVKAAVNEIKDSYNIQYCQDGYDFINQLTGDEVARIMEEMDFNDLIVYELCKKHNCVLITDDADYVNKKNTIDILTCNRSFF